MIREFKVSVMEWLKYADAIGDVNPIHRYNDIANKHGLSARIAPGMYLASRIQGMEKILGIKSIRFSGNVHNGEEIFYEEKSRGKAYNYIFRRDDDVVCEMKGVRFGGASGKGKPLKDVLHVYETEISIGRIGLFIEGTGNFSPGILPDMFLASLSASALFDLGVKKGLTGVHVFQNFNAHREYMPGPIEFRIGDKKDKNSLSFLEMRVIQNGEIINSMRAGVLPFST
jgi:hypothetical protein